MSACMHADVTVPYTDIKDKVTERRWQTKQTLSNYSNLPRTYDAMCSDTPYIAWNLSSGNSTKLNYVALYNSNMHLPGETFCNSSSRFFSLWVSWRLPSKCSCSLLGLMGEMERGIWASTECSLLFGVLVKTCPGVSGALSFLSLGGLSQEECSLLLLIGVIMNWASLELPASEESERSGGLLYIAAERHCPVWVQLSA